MSSSNRRDFLQHLAVGAAAVGTMPSILAAGTTRASERENGNGTPVLLDELLADDNAMQERQWDTSWMHKVTGKHRAVFDSPQMEGASAVFRAGAWPNHYKQAVKGTEDSDLSTVLVIRHAAIPLIMTQAFWEEYKIGKKNKVEHPVTGKRTNRNPAMLDVETDKLPPAFARYALDKQIAAGTIVLGCNVAFGQMVGMVAEKNKLKGEEARARALAGVIPGVILQPSGMIGLLLAQEAGCNYLMGS